MWRLSASLLVMSTRWTRCPCDSTSSLCHRHQGQRRPLPQRQQQSTTPKECRFEFFFFFFVHQRGFLLANAKISKYYVEDLLDVDAAGDATDAVDGRTEFFCDQDEVGHLAADDTV